MEFKLLVNAVLSTALVTSRVWLLALGMWLVRAVGEK